MFNPRFGHLAFCREDQVFILFGKGGHSDLAEAKDLDEVFVLDLDSMYLKVAEVTGLKDWMKGSNFTSIPLSQDLLLVLGFNLRKICIFNAASQSFMEITSIGVNPPPRSRYSLTESVDEGKIILVGGTDKNEYYNDVY